MGCSHPLPLHTHTRAWKKTKKNVLCKISRSAKIALVLYQYYNHHSDLEGLVAGQTAIQTGRWMAQFQGQLRGAAAAESQRGDGHPLFITKPNNPQQNWSGCVWPNGRGEWMGWSGGQGGVRGFLGLIGGCEGAGGGRGRFKFFLLLLFFSREV